MAQQPYFKGIPKKKSLDGILRVDPKAKTGVIKKVVETAKPDINPTGPVAKKYLTKEQREQVAKRAPEVAKKEALKNLTTNVTVPTSYGKAVIQYKGFRALDPDKQRALLDEMRLKIEAAEDAKRKPEERAARTVNPFTETKPVDVDSETKRILGGLESTVLGAMYGKPYQSADRFVQDAKKSNESEPNSIAQIAKGLGLSIAESTLRPASTFEGQVGNMYDPDATAEERLGAIGNAGTYVASILPEARGLIEFAKSIGKQGFRGAAKTGLKTFAREAIPFSGKLGKLIDGPVVNDLIPASVRQGIDFNAPRQADPASGVATPPEPHFTAGYEPTGVPPTAPASFADQQRAMLRDVLGADDVSGIAPEPMVAVKPSAKLFSANPSAVSGIHTGNTGHKINAAITRETDKAVLYQFRFINPNAKAGKKEAFVELWVPKSMISPDGIIQDTAFFDKKIEELQGNFNSKFKYASSYSDWRLDPESYSYLKTGEQLPQPGESVRAFNKIAEDESSRLQKNADATKSRQLESQNKSIANNIRQLEEDGHLLVNGRKVKFNGDIAERIQQERNRLERNQSEIDRIASKYTSTPESTTAPSQRSAAQPQPTAVEPPTPVDMAPTPKMADMTPREPSAPTVTATADAPQNVTGISNAANLSDFEQGILSSAPEGKGRSVKEIYETNRGRKDYDNVADRVSKGEALTADNAAAILAGKAEYTAKVRSAKDAIEQGIVDGVSESDMTARRSALDKAIEDATEYAEKIQRGKSEWSDVGRTLAAYLDVDTRDIASVLQEARIRKGSALTAEEIAKREAEVKALTDLLEESKAEIARLMKAHADNATKVAAARKIVRTPEARAAKRKQALDEFFAASSGLNAYVNPKVIKQFAKYMYTLIEDGARSVDDIVAAAAKDGVKADYEDVYAAMRSQVKESTLSDLQKEIAKTKRELMAAAKADDPNTVLPGRRQMTTEQKIRFREGALRNEIVKLDKQIEQKKRFPKGAKIESPEIKRLDAIRKEKQATLDEITKPQKEAKAATDRAAVIQSQIDELKKKAADGTLTAPEKKVVDANIADLMKQRDAALKAAQDASIDYNMGTLVQKDPKLPKEISPEAKAAAELNLRTKAEIDAWNQAERAKAKEEADILRNLKADSKGLTKEQRAARQKELDDALGNNAKADNLREQIVKLLEQAEDGTLPAPKKKEIDDQIKALEIERRKALKAAQDASPEYQANLLEKDKERLRTKLKALEDRIANKDYAEVSIVKNARRTDNELDLLRQKIRVKESMVKAGIEAMRPRSGADKVGNFLNEIKLLNPASRLKDFTANSVKGADFVASSILRRGVDWTTSKILGEDMITKGTTADRNRRVLAKAKNRMIADAELIAKGADPDSIKKYGSYKGIGGKAAGLTDVPFKSYYYEWMQDAAADYKARKTLGKGATPEAIATKREEILANIDEHPDIQLMAEEYSLNQTFNNQNWASSLLGSAKRDATGTGKVLIDEFIGRFAKVITNVATDATDRTGIGVLRGGKKILDAKMLGQSLSVSERAIINDMITKGATGMATLALGYFLGDKIPGTIKGERGKYVDFGDLESIGGPISPLLLGAIFKKAESIEDPEQAAGLRLASVLRLPINTPLASNSKDLLNALSDSSSTQGAKKLLARKISNVFIPGGVRDIAERMDSKGGSLTGSEVEREKIPKEINPKTKKEVQTKNFLEILKGDVKSKIPFVRQTLPIKKSDADKKKEKADAAAKKKSNLLK